MQNLGGIEMKTIIKKIAFLTIVLSGAPVALQAMEQQKTDETVVTDLNPTDRLYCDGKLTLDAIAEKLKKDHFTNTQLTLFAHELLQDRIFYWQEALKNAKTEEELCKIPLYIRLKPDITTTEMLGNCTIFGVQQQDVSLEEILGNNTLLGEVIGSKGGIECIPQMRMNAICSVVPAVFLFTLLHELTHVEQRANYRLYPVKSCTDCSYYTNRHASALYVSHEQTKTDIICLLDDINCEWEADHHAIKFMPNPALGAEFPIKAKGGPLGYMPHEKKRELAENYATTYYKKYPQRLKRDREQAKVFYGELAIN